MKIHHHIHFSALLLTALLPHAAHAAPATLPTKGLLLDLNASKVLKLENGNKIASWENQAPGKNSRLFIKQDRGRKVKGSGCPTLKKNVNALNGESTLVFKQQELVNMEEYAFDHLNTGNGYTWITVMEVDKHRVGVKDVNSFFGDLKNGGKYEGFWACLNARSRIMNSRKPSDISPSTTVLKT